MQQWQYKVIQQNIKRIPTKGGGLASLISGDDLAWDSEVSLPELGREGWELVSVTVESYDGYTLLSASGRTSTKVWVFKRPLHTVPPQD